MLVEAARLLWQRRMWVALALIAALGAGAGAFVSTPPTQRSMAQVLFVPSVKQPGVEGPTNPFLSLSGSVAVVASLIQISVSDDQTVSALAGQGHTATYIVEPNLNENAGPVLIVTTESRSAAQAQGTMHALIETMKSDLRERQTEQGVRADLMVSLVVLTSTDKPTVVRKTQLQIAVAAMAATLVVLVGLLLLVDRRRLRRAARRNALMASAPGDNDSGHREGPSGRAGAEREARLQGAAEGDGAMSGSSPKR